MPVTDGRALVEQAQQLYDWFSTHPADGGPDHPPGPVRIANALRAVQPTAHLGYSEDEQRVERLIIDALNGIQNLNGRVLRANRGELVAAVHVLQSFVQQSALARLGLLGASDWWGEPAAPGATAPDVRCPTCRGTGGGVENDCPTCDGNGVV